jgi:hypothetical protein
MMIIVASLWTNALAQGGENIAQTVKHRLVQTCSMPEEKFRIDMSELRTEDTFMVIGGTAEAFQECNEKNDNYCEEFFLFCLQKKKEKWEIVYDLGGGDVPSPKEIKQIKKDFPPAFPKKLLPKFWQDMFETIQLVVKKKSEITIKHGVVFYRNKKLDDGKYEIHYDYAVYMKFQISKGKILDLVVSE